MLEGMYSITLSYIYTIAHQHNTDTDLHLQLNMYVCLSQLVLGFIKVQLHIELRGEQVEKQEEQKTCWISYYSLR